MLSITPPARMRLQDEVFHVRQTQRFCTGNLEYDPMITTFPGVYIVGVCWALALHFISWGAAILASTPPLPMVCSPQHHACHTASCS
jgi:DIE2/ALG10 family